MLLLRSWLQRWRTPLALFGATLLSYGLWIPWMGLFGNDLPYLYYYHLLGPWGPGLFASVDRPISALFYAAATFLLGESVWPYHVLLLFLRWLSAVLLWWVLGLVWPERKREAALAGLLFAVYPGFRQNPVALEFILHFFVLDLFLLSIGSMLMAACRPRRFWPLTLMTVTGTAGLFFLEYFVGLEILRPVFLWIVTRRVGLRGKAQWQRILAAWLPALAVALAFITWRVFFFSTTTYQPVLIEALRSNPLAGLMDLGRRMLTDLWTASGGAWLQTLRLPEGPRSLMVYLALLALGAGLAFLLYRADKDRQPATNPLYWGETLLGVGVLAALAGGSIFWVLGIPITLEFPWDRSTLALMPGASLALVGLLEMAISARYRPVVVAGLAALAVGMHFVNAQEYQAEWKKLQDFSWQLSWRAPQLEPGTLILFDAIPLNRYSDNDLTVLLNWIYAPDLHSKRIFYKFFDLEQRLNGSIAGLPGVDKDLPMQVNHRGLTFESTTSSSLALAYDPPYCLKILDPDQDRLLPDLPDRLKTVLPITRLAQVRDDAAGARPPVQLGSEPQHGWCYYFQKADLARQRKDWKEVAALGDQASQAGLNAETPAELLPFIEGYAMLGNLDQARALNAAAVEQAALKPALCALWARVKNQAGKDQAAAGMQKPLDCRP